MEFAASGLAWVLATLFVVTQALYFLSYMIEAYFFSLPINWVRMAKDGAAPPREYPYIVLLYPVLNELESTMRTTFEAIAQQDYPANQFEVVAIPNASDPDTLAALHRLQASFSFLQVMEVPPTTDPAWNIVWANWDHNRHAYWWHKGARRHGRDLPPKKTRQLVYAFYTLADRRGAEDFLVNYIDADSAPPRDHFLAAAYGMRDYDVLQSTNVAGNLNDSLAASFHGFDHMAWDGRKYPHMSADGKHPYWVLGKGVFFRASDLVELGSFNPWITIEDPEIGMRFWKNGRRLGIIEAPLIEETPVTFGRGITQRKRWVAGFFQSLNLPLKAMGFTRAERFKAWLNFLPCLSMWVNLVGLPVGIWALVAFIQGTGPLPRWTYSLSGVNLLLYLWMMVPLYVATWRRTALVLSTRRARIWYMLKINPLMLWIWWLVWLVPLWIGWRMYRKDTGLVWERTEKFDLNNELVRRRLAAEQAVVTVPVTIRTKLDRA
jgi:cellulose synthase/poly-beta-1,6-N-acetylglucosamine synthase-like glycosyltransferase